MENEKKAVCLEGCLDILFEGHMGGLAFTFNEKDKKGYDALSLLQKGDYLKVFNQGKVFWEGEINPKMAEFYSSYYGTGYQDPQWMNMFFNKYPAELYKNNR